MIEHLISAGFSEEDAVSRQELIARAVNGFRHTARREPRWGWFVPGRIEIFGKHTDYAGGRSLLAAVPRGFAVVAAPRDDGRVRVTDARWGTSMHVTLGDETTRFVGWSNYIAVVVRRLCKNFPGAALGANLAIASDLPRAAGLSSSSALVVAVASALIRTARLDARPEWQAAIQSTQDLAGYLGAVENGLRFATLDGTGGVGTHGGSEDHTAILTCLPGRVSAYTFVPVRSLGDAPMTDAWRFVVASSGIQADKAGSAKDRYNRASLATRALVEFWNGATGERHVTLAAVLASDSGSINRLHELAASTPHPSFAADSLKRRLAHFVGEDARIPDAIEAFRSADQQTLGELSAASQSDAALLLGNQIPETEALAALARELGAFASSSFGAGFGGSVWALIDADRAGLFATRWVDAYSAAWPSIPAVEWFVTRPAPGVTEIAVTS